MRWTGPALAVATVVLAYCGTALAANPVSVFPTPGSRTALPRTQIVFRSVAPGAIGAIRVLGSRTGIHTGRIEADSDGQGGSFIPDTPFEWGDTVTVTTGLNVLGGRNGGFRFTIARGWGTLQLERLPYAPAGRRGVQHFRSRPDLQPAAVAVTKHSAPASLGDIFVAPQLGPSQNGPMVLDPFGNLVWFHPLPRNVVATDFRVQQLYGRPVLTWWQGGMSMGSGRGEDVIFDSSYHQIATVRAADGLQGADLHEFLLTPQGQAWIIGASPIHWGRYRRPLIDSVVQELDVKTGLVLFEWHALDHVPLSESFFKGAHASGHVIDPFHLNSITMDQDGNPIVSMRNTWAAYKIDRQTGAVIWTLGSNHSSFKLGPGVRTAFQHNLVVQPDGTFTLFDDGAGPPTVHSQSRAIRVVINTKTMTATLLGQYEHSPRLLAHFEGGSQLLPGGDMFVGWGEQPYFSEFNPRGRLDFDAHFVAPTPSYRAYRFPWSAQPPAQPAVALKRGADGISAVYASWNGATDVASWRLLAGRSRRTLATIATVPKRRFETSFQAHSELPYFAVQALRSSGRTLASSPTVGTSATRLSIFGHSAFVSSGGFGGLFVGCFSARPCRLATTLNAGRSVVARTGGEAVGARDSGVVYFSLTRAGRKLLSRARGDELAVSASVRNFDRTTTSTSLDVMGYRTRGSAPRYSVRQAPTIRIVSHGAFVNRTGIGGVFAACSSSQACYAKATVSAGREVIARTGTEFIGAEDSAVVFFKLTAAGKARLAHARGNQLAVGIAVTNGRHTASERGSLVRFG